MSCTSNNARHEWTDQVPFTFDQWKTILSKLTKEEPSKKISSNSNPHRRPASRQCSSSSRRQDRHSLPRNQVFSDTAVDSFLISSSTITQSALEAPKLISTSTKRYVSSFKTLVNSTSGKHNQRVSYANDSVIILKLCKENVPESIGVIPQSPEKRAIISMATSTTPPPRQAKSSPSRSSPVLKIEGNKRRTVPNETSSVPPSNTEVSASSISTHAMAMSATSHPSANPSLFAYRSTITAGSTVRQRAVPETVPTSLFITTERLKSNTSSSMRPARQPSTTTATTAAATTAISSVYVPFQQPQRNNNQSTKPRIQQEKSTISKDLYQYPDPFTNCPPDILSKLAQLTRLQLETVDWEKKRRYIKKKPVTNSTTHGKDSP